MEQNIIGLGFDLNEFSAEQQKIIKGLLEVYDLSKQIGETQIKPGSTGGFTELKAKSEALRTLAADHEKLIAVQQKSMQVEQQSISVTKQSTAAIQQENKSLQENIQQRIRIQNSMASYLASQKEDLALLRSGVITRQEYNKRIVESNIRIEQYKNELLVINKEIKSQTLSTKQQADAYGVLNKEYLLAQRNAKNLATIYGVESAEAKQAAAAAALLDTELKSIDKSVGQSQRNVGNYASALNGAWSAVRKLAYALPGVGIAGLLAFAIDPIVDFFQWTLKADKATQKLIESQKDVSDIRVEANKTAAEEVVNLKLVYAETQNVSSSTKKRTEAAKYLQETYPETFKNFTTEEILLGKAKGGYDALTTSILKNAMAQAAKNKLIELSNKEFDLQDKQYELQQKVLKSNDAIQAQKQKAAAEGFNTKGLAAQQGEQTRNLRLLQMEGKGFQDQLEANQKALDLLAEQKKKIADFIGTEGLAESVISGSGGKDKKEKIKKDKDDYNKIYSDYIKEVLDGFKKLDEAERVHYENQNELTEQERQIREQALDAVLAAAKRVQDEENAAIEAHKAIRLSNFDNELSRKEISLKEYNQKKKAEENAALVATLEVSKKELEAELSVAKIRQQNLTLLQTQIDKINAQINSAKASGVGGDEKEPASRQKEYYAQIEKDAFAAYSFVSDLVRARYENEMNYLQKLIDKNDELKQTQINNIRQSTVSEQEKAAQIISLEASVAAQNEALRRKIREEKRKEAIFDRDTAIIRIAAETAVAVMKVIAQGGLYTTGLAVATAAFGALQIASLLARPIPTYGDGTDNHPGGPMIVGEKKQGSGYQPELVTIPGQAPFITNRPMLMNAAAGTKVKPLTGDNINETMYAAMMQYTAQAIGDRTAQKLDEIKNATVEGSRMLLSAMNKQKAPITNIIVDAGWHAHISKSVIN